jgi:HEAT repeat protein
VVPDLVRYLTNEPSPYRMNACINRALVNLGAYSAALDLVRLLPTDYWGQEYSDFDERRKRQNIAWALGELGERSVAPDLMKLLAEGFFDLSLRSEIARALGKLQESSIVPDLLDLLAKEKDYIFWRWTLIETIEQVAEDESTILRLFELLGDPDLADKVYKALWTISRRIMVRLSVTKGVKKKLKIVKW